METTPWPIFQKQSEPHDGITRLPEPPRGRSFVAPASITHGATYQPQTGLCRSGPCRGGLIKIALSEVSGSVHWHTSDKLKPLDFPYDRTP